MWNAGTKPGAGVGMCISRRMALSVHCVLAYSLPGCTSGLQRSSIIILSLFFLLLLLTGGPLECRRGW